MTKSEGKEVIMSGWKVAGIIEAIEKGSTQLESLDPFSDFYLLLTQTTNDETSLANLDEDEREAFTNPYTEDDKESDDDNTYLS